MKYYKAVNSLTSAVYWIQTENKLWEAEMSRDDIQSRPETEVVSLKEISREEFEKSQ